MSQAVAISWLQKGNFSHHPQWQAPWQNFWHNKDTNYRRLVALLCNSLSGSIPSLNQMGLYSLLSREASWVRVSTLQIEMHDVWLSWVCPSGTSLTRASRSRWITSIRFVRSLNKSLNFSRLQWDPRETHRCLNAISSWGMEIPGTDLTRWRPLLRPWAVPIDTRTTSVQ
jgi:hypothetical protein